MCCVYAVQTLHACCFTQVSSEFSFSTYDIMQDITWPNGVRSADDLQKFCKALFGAQCKPMDLLAGSALGLEAGEDSFLWRLPLACGPASPFAEWPDLVMRNMQEVQSMRGPDEIHVKCRANGPRARIYDSVQITSQPCICRVHFGGDRQQHAETSSDSTASGGMIYSSWKNSLAQHGYTGPFSTKACHFVLNRYVHASGDGIDAHADKSVTYHFKNPILSFSFLTGSLLVIKGKRLQGAFYQYPGDIIVMAGKFQEIFQHEVPPLSKWTDTYLESFEGRKLSQAEMTWAHNLRDLYLANKDHAGYRVNVTLRWHETHFARCPFVILHNPSNAGEPNQSMPSPIASNPGLDERVRATLESYVAAPSYEGLLALLPILPMRSCVLDVLANLRDEEHRHLMNITTLLSQVKSPFDVIFNDVWLKSSHRLHLVEARRKLSECTGMLGLQLFNEIQLLPTAVSTSEKGFVRVAVSFDEAIKILEDIDPAELSARHMIYIRNSMGKHYFDGFTAASSVFRLCRTGGKPFRLRYLEANYPAAPYIRRLEPLHGSIRKILKMDASTDNTLRVVEALVSIMKAIQNYILLEDSSGMYGLRSFRYFFPAGSREHLGQNVICLWISGEETR